MHLSIFEWSSPKPQSRGRGLEDGDYHDEAKRIKDEMLKMINAQAKDPGLQKYQDIFRRHPERIFQWAENRSVPAENNMSERGVRRTVIARKVCGCDGPGHLHP